MVYGFKVGWSVYLHSVWTFQNAAGIVSCWPNYIFAETYYIFGISEIFQEHISIIMCGRNVRKGDE